MSDLYSMDVFDIQQLFSIRIQFDCIRRKSHRYLIYKYYMPIHYIFLRGIQLTTNHIKKADYTTSFFYRKTSRGLELELETAINSLSDGVKLNKSIPKSKRLTGSAEVWVFEVEVVCDGDELRIKKVN